MLDRADIAGPSRLISLSVLLVVVAFGFHLVGPNAAETLVNGRRSLVLEGGTAQLVVDLAGGSIADFHLNPTGLNPFHWEEPGGPTAARPRGHFLCLDRWGAPSEAEQKNGMPFHGEAARVDWHVVRAPELRGDRFEAEVSAALPLAGLKITRRIELSKSNAFFVMRETVSNANKLGRIFNMVQHPTIGPPFLDEQTVIDANAGRGFMQSSPLPNPEEPSVRWPEAFSAGRRVDLRTLRGDHDPNVVSFTIDGELGWVTAASPSQGLLVAYVWRTADYPWFNAWRHAEKGKPVARGLEFGTTGLHQPFGILVAKGRIFGRALYEYLDAGEARTKSYACFLFQIPHDYQGVATLDYDGKRVVLRERRDGRRQRDLTMMEVGSLFDALSTE